MSTKSGEQRDVSPCNYLINILFLRLQEQSTQRDDALRGDRDGELLRRRQSRGDQAEQEHARRLPEDPELHRHWRDSQCGSGRKGEWINNLAIIILRHPKNFKTPEHSAFLSAIKVPMRSVYSGLSSIEWSLIWHKN